MNKSFRVWTLSILLIPSAKVLAQSDPKELAEKKVVESKSEARTDDKSAKKKEVRAGRESKEESTAREDVAPDPLKTLEYPELLVTPRASDRLELEAKDEGLRSWYMHLPLQLAAGMTYFTAKTADRENNNEEPSNKSEAVAQGAKFASYVGAGWFLGSLYLAAAYRPYRSAQRNVKPMGRGTKREVLIRERLAEEEIHDVAKIGSRIEWLATGTMLPLCLYLAVAGKGDSTIVGALATITTLAPVVFRYRWEEVSERHLYYKKRIYGPVAMTTIIPVADKYVPTAQFLWSF